MVVESFAKLFSIRIRLAMEASSSSDSLFDGMPDHFPDSMPSSDEVTNPSHNPHIPTFIMLHHAPAQDFEDERPGALSRLTDACMELVSAVGDLSVAGAQPQHTK